MKLSYRIIPTAGGRCFLEPHLDGISVGVHPFTTVAAAQRYVEQTFRARDLELRPAWSPVVLECVQTQTVEVIS